MAERHSPSVCDLQKGKESTNKSCDILKRYNGPKHSGPNQTASAKTTAVSQNPSMGAGAAHKGPLLAEALQQEAEDCSVLCGCHGPNSSSGLGQAPSPAEPTHRPLPLIKLGKSYTPGN